MRPPSLQPPEVRVSTLAAVSRFLLTGCVFAVLFRLYYGPDGEPVYFTNGFLRISDFSYYVLIVRGFWEDPRNGLYDFAANLRVISEAVGQDVRGIMPLAVTPAAALVFLPFSILSWFGLAAAKFVWCGFSLAALVLSLLRLRQDWDGLSSRFRARALVIGLILFGSNAFFTTLWLGQTSLFFLASMIVLFDTARRGGREYPLAALFYVGLKPTYFGLAVAMLAAFRAWRQIAVAAAVLLASCLLMTALDKGLSWAAGYVEMFSAFSRLDLDARLRAPFAFDQMNVLRSAWLRFCSEAALLAISKAVLASAIAVAGWSILRDLLDPSGAKGRAPGVRCFAGLLSAYLLFAPYASTYEDIILVFPAVLLIGLSPDRISSPAFLGFIALLFLSLNFLTLVTPATRELLWIAKAGCVAVMVVLLPRAAAAPGRGTGIEPSDVSARPSAV